MSCMVVTVVLKLPRGQQRDVSVPLGVLSNRILPLVGMLVILPGVLRGTVWGSVQSFAFLLGTPYGLTFLLAFLVACAVLLWGTFVTCRAATRLNTFPLIEVMKPESTVALAFNAQIRRVK